MQPFMANHARNGVAKPNQIGIKFPIELLISNVIEKSDPDSVLWCICLGLANCP